MPAVPVTNEYGDRKGTPDIRGVTGKGGAMTETREADVIQEALQVIDKALSEMLHRELVSSGEVADVLLDLRSLLTKQHALQTQ